MVTANGAPGEDDRAGFEHWLIDKSFSMLGPICRIGVVVTLVLLLAVDPLLYSSGIWGNKPQHLQLVIWHGCALAYFVAYLLATRLGTSHTARKTVLVTFFMAAAGLFSVFAFVSWTLSGDLSTYAIFLLLMVCVFGFPGMLRSVLNLVATAALVTGIVLADGWSTFYASGAAVNLVALALVSIFIDRYLMRLNLALYREKRLVEHERARADRVLYNALPVSIADELKNNNMVKAEKYQKTAVLFADIVGFTAFSAVRSPDIVVRVLNEVFSEFDTLVDRHAVEKIKTIGDAYMVVGKDQLPEIAHLALQMQNAMVAYSARNGYSLGIRCGIHVGPTVAGVIGLKRFLYDVWGDAVNTASRMESTGECDRIQVSDDVFRALKDDFLFEARGGIAVKGKGTMQTYFLLAPRADPETSGQLPRAALHHQS